MFHTRPNILFFFCAFVLCSCPNVFGYSGGTGDPNDPYQIATREDLLALGATPSDYGKSFILTADIDLDPCLPGGQVFTTAIIADYDSFTGIFDGQDHHIFNLTGTLFGSSLGLVKNLGITNCSSSVAALMVWNDGTIVDCCSTGTVGSDTGDPVGGLVEFNCGTISRSSSGGQVRGQWWVGGLVGMNDLDAQLDNCYSTAAVTASSGAQAIGGLVGIHYMGSINDCHFVGTVIAGDNSEFIGGLAGWIDVLSPITNCYSEGTVSVGSNSGNVGGLVGICQSDITNSYSTCNVSGNSNTGGLGGLAGGISGNISNCYATGAVSGTHNVGGLAGGAGFGGIIDSYSTGAVSGTYYLGGLIGTSREANLKNSYSTGNVNGSSYGIGGLIGYIERASVDGCYSTGAVSGTYGTGGLVGRYNPYYDRDAFIANSHSTGLVSGTDYVGGLIGETDTRDSIVKGSIYNCYSSADVNGHDYVGGLIGQSGADVNNCFSTGRVTGSSKTGGLIGEYNGASGHTVKNSYSASNVNGTESVGGLIGRCYGQYVNCCYSIGDVNGINFVGGLIGTDNGNFVINCYSRSSIIGATYVGGLIGYVTGTTRYVFYCYSAGFVTGSEFVGGLVGAGNSSIPDYALCFWDTETSGQTASSQGIAKNTVEMKTLSTFTSADWDFQNVWSINEGIDYPRFIWEPLPLVCDVKIAPQTINRRSNQPYIHAVLSGVNYEEVDTNEKLFIYPGSIKAAEQSISDSGIYVCFDKTALMSELSGSGDIEFKIAGKLKSGRYFYGSDTVKIIDQKSK